MVVFGEKQLELLNPASNRDMLSAALAKIDPLAGAKELNTAIAIAAQQLREEARSDSRRAIVMVTDNHGVEGAPARATRDMLWRTDTVLCGLLVDDGAPAEASAGVRPFIRATGGEAFAIGDKRLALAECFRSLRERYLLTFRAPGGEKKTIHTIEVELSPQARVLHPDAVVLVRGGLRLLGGGGRAPADLEHRAIGGRSTTPAFQLLYPDPSISCGLRTLYITSGGVDMPSDQKVYAAVGKRWRSLGQGRSTPASAALLLASLAPVLPAQTTISAKAGLVDYTQGDVYLDNHAVEATNTHFLDVKENDVMRTGSGRAEVLLGACTAMWIGGNTSFRMLSNSLSDTRIELLTGSAMIAVGAVSKDSRLALTTKLVNVLPGRKGLYRFDMEPSRLEVLGGVATVEWSGQSIPVGQRWARSR